MNELQKDNTFLNSTLIVTMAEQRHMDAPGKPISLIKYLFYLSTVQNSSIFFSDASSVLLMDWRSVQFPDWITP